MSIEIVSNNSLVKEKYENVIFIEGDYIDVLISCRDLIHKGYSLISHPLPASIRMVFSSVRSVLLEKNSSFDEESALIIEDSIEKYKLTMKNRKIDYKNIKDYEFVDLMLVESAIEEHKVLTSF